MTTAPPYALVDRSVIQPSASGAGGDARRMSELAKVDRLVLLGEPGSGKSIAFSMAAAAASVGVVTAKAFVEGARPPGKVVFIDALEEYRIGEPAQERLADLASALKSASYARWRIACRSISLPREGARDLGLTAGAFETWLLDSLSNVEIRAILGHLGEAEPSAFMDRMNAIAAGPLMGNPATLKLLQRTAASGGDLSTRGALLDRAVRQMAHELNDGLPEWRERPTIKQILAAAEVASLVLLVSGRLDIWHSNRMPPTDDFVTRDDLREGKVDIRALAAALDTPLFVGEGGAFHPNHRIVAEYLAGRTLAEAADPQDGRAALTVDRAVALLCGAGNRPAPALSGVFAWFVAALARTRHVGRALELVGEDPESIALYGDPAMLPTEHRRALLAAIGRRDPWFLSNVRGATAMGGIAGDDVAAELIAIAINPKEQDHRRILVLDALASGRPVVSIRPQLFALAADPTVSEWFRRRAIEAVLNGDDAADVTRRQLLSGLASEPKGGPILLRLHLLAGLIGRGATAAEVRGAMIDYGATGDGVMGYLRPLSEALEFSPMADLFDEPIPGATNPRSRGFELAGAVERILAATIRANPGATPERLVGWVGNLGLAPFSNLKAVLREAIADWSDHDPARPLALYDAIATAAAPKDVWSAAHQYRIMMGREVPDDVKAVLVRRLEAARAVADAGDASRHNDLELLGELAARVTRPARDNQGLSDRVMAVLQARPDLHKSTLGWVLPSEERPWEAKQAARDAEYEAERQKQRDNDRSWLSDHADTIRSGAEAGALIYAAQIAVGYHAGADIPDDRDRMTAWFGPEVAADLRQGWERIAEAFPVEVSELGAREGQRLDVRLEAIAPVMLAERLAAGGSLDLSLPFAFAVLRASYVLRDDESREAVTRVAVERILRDDAGREALLAYWEAAVAAGAQDLPDLLAFEEGNGGVAEVLERLVAERSDLPAPVLASALGGCVRRIGSGKLRVLVETALRRMLPVEAHRLWSILAFFLDPAIHADVFDRCLGDDDGRAAFKSFLQLAVDNGLSRDAVDGLRRDEMVAMRFGAVTGPEDDPHQRSDEQQIVAGAIARLAASPLAQAGLALERLKAEPRLEPWGALLQNRIASQDGVRLDAEFKAPRPDQVAKALDGGPPANPADLRAVLREVLAELGEDILTAPTSPWRGYWNFPHGVARSPKEENDCRDLLTDRLNDRLRPFRIPVRLMTEIPSRRNRRVDLVVIGEAAAALPIEAKRHYNSELWTAVEDQVLDYAASLKSSGHGIYLVFWFGAEHQSVPTPPGGVPIKTAKALQKTLSEHLPEAARGLVDVVVIDVAYQPTQTELDEAAAAARRAAQAAAGKPARKGGGRKAKGDSGKPN